MTVEESDKIATEHEVEWQPIPFCRPPPYRNKTQLRLFNWGCSTPFSVCGKFRIWSVIQIQPCCFSNHSLTAAEYPCVQNNNLATVAIPTNTMECLQCISRILKTIPNDGINFRPSMEFKPLRSILWLNDCFLPTSRFFTGLYARH